MIPPSIALGLTLCEKAIIEEGTEEVIHSHPVAMRFPDHLAQLGVLFRMSAFVFPEPGPYLFTLLVDGAWVAHRKLHVVQ